MRHTSFYRRITDLLPNKQLKDLKNINKKFKKMWTGASVKKIRLYFKNSNKPLNNIILIFLVFSALFLSVLAYGFNQLYLELKEQRNEGLKHATYWEDVVKKHPNYPDAYYQAAWYFYTLGYKKKAYTLLEKALFMNPDFREAKELEEKIIKE